MNSRTGIGLGLAISLVGGMLSTGCTTVGALYPKFKEQSAQIKTLAISTDVLVLEDVRGPLPLVDVPRDLALAAELNTHLAAELEKRGFKIAHSERTSVGLRYGLAVTPAIKVRSVGQPTTAALDTLATSSAPYWLAADYEDKAKRGTLQNAYEDLRRATPKPGVPNVISAAVRNLGPSNDSTHRLFVIVEGVQVPMSKGLAQALTTGLLTLGAVAVFEMTSVNFRVGLADISTGEFILISDCTIAGGWTVNDTYLKRQAGIFLAQLDQLRK